MNTKAGKGYFYAQGQRAKIEHSWAFGKSPEFEYVLLVITKDIRPDWAKYAFRQGFYGRHLY